MMRLRNICLGFLLSTYVGAQQPISEWSATKKPSGNEVKSAVGNLAFPLSKDVSYKVGKPSYFLFNGDGAKVGAVKLSDQSSVASLPKSAITVEAWIKIRKPQKWGGILSTAEDNGAYERGFILGFHENTFYWGIAGSGTNPIKLSYQKSDTTWVKDYWYHVVGTYDGVVQKIYVDGKLAGTSKVQKGDIKYAEKFIYSIGGYWDMNEKYSGNYQLESCTIWGEALTDAQVQKRFQKRKNEFPDIEGSADSQQVHKDWPTYKRNNKGTAHYPYETPDSMQLKWSYRTARKPQQAWPGTAQSDWWRKRGTPEKEKAVFDRAFEVVAAKEKIYFGSSSDDHIYCLDQKTGELVWKYATEGPVRFAPTVYEGNVIAGSDDGSVYCLNAMNGELVWKVAISNVSQRKLPGNGRMISLYPVRTNILVDKGIAHFGCGLFPKNAGAWYVSVDVKSGKIVTQRKIDTSPQGYLEERGGKLFTPTGRHPAGSFLADLQRQGKVSSLATVRIPKDYPYAFIRSNSHHFGGGKNQIAMISSGDGKILWKEKVEGEARSMALSHDDLIVSTDEGVIYCYGKKSSEVVSHVQKPASKANASDKDVDRILSKLPSKRGYALVLGLDNLDFIRSLAQTSELQLIVVSTDKSAVLDARDKLWDEGLYGQVVVHHFSSMSKLNYTERSFNLVTSAKGINASKWKKWVRPNTGIVMSKSDAQPLYKAAAVKGAGSWNHMYGNSGNTACSGDEVVGSSLELQWFGRPGPEYIMDRHLRPPPALVHNGIMAVPGRDYLICVDTWNGTILWEKPVKNFQRTGAYRDSGNMVMREDYLYCVTGDGCKVFDLFTGEEKLSLPVQGEDHEWGYVASVGKGLVGSAVKKGGVYRETSFNAIYENNYGDKTKVTCSDFLFAKDRHTGKTFWKYQPQGVIINPSIALSDKYAIFVESANTATLGKKTARFDFPELVQQKGAQIVAVDLKNGRKVWSQKLKSKGDVRTLHLICEKNNLVLVYSHNSVAKGAEKKTVHYTTSVYSVDKGTLKWEDTNGTGRKTNLDHGEQDLHPALLGNQLIVEPLIYDLTNGKRIGKFDRKGYGCGTISASSKSLYYRAGNIATYDLDKKKGETITSVNRPGCWINMIPAGGMLLVPEGSSGCICKFAIQTSMGFVPKK